MEESLRAQRLRGSQNDVSHPPSLNVTLRDPHSKISVMGPEFLATALRAITVSGPSTVYHFVFTPIYPFLTVTQEFFSTWRWKVFNRLLTYNPSSPGHRWCMTSQQTNVRPVFAIPEDFFQDLQLMKSIMMWMRTCGQIHKTMLIKTKKCSEEL